MARGREPKEGDILGEWRLVSKLGKGGNGVVWKVVREGRHDAALKVLRRMDEASYLRFKAEIDVLATHVDIPGVVPLIDSYLPERTNLMAPPWYVMPLAAPSSEFLRGKSIVETVREFVSLARTLGVLHERNISHRDIKPQNILALHGRLCLSDFGLVKFPERQAITPPRRDVGPKFTMAPEMRRFAAAADGLPADVFSFAKTLWIALTGEALGFDGQYSATSDVALKRHMKSPIYTTKLDTLLEECTRNDPAARPSIAIVETRLQEWLDLVGDFHIQNLTEWTELMQRLFPLGAPNRVTWSDMASICAVLQEIGKVQALNHMFYPDGGGNTITSVSPAAEEGFIEIDALIVSILKPLKLTLESFGAGSEWNYFRLEADVVEPTGLDSVDPGDFREYLTEIVPGRYGSRRLWENAGSLDYEEEDLPSAARPVTRYLKGSFVLFSTRSPYNLNPATYDARHEAFGEDGFRDYVRKNALGGSTLGRRSVKVVR